MFKKWAIPWLPAFCRGLFLPETSLHLTEFPGAFVFTASCWALVFNFHEGREWETQPWVHLFITRHSFAWMKRSFGNSSTFKVVHSLRIVLSVMEKKKNRRIRIHSWEKGKMLMSLRSYAVAPFEHSSWCCLCLFFLDGGLHLWKERNKRGGATESGERHS